MHIRQCLLDNAQQDTLIKQRQLVDFRADPQPGLKFRAPGEALNVAPNRGFETVPCKLRWVKQIGVRAEFLRRLLQIALNLTAQLVRWTVGAYAFLYTHHV